MAAAKFMEASPPRGAPSAPAAPTPGSSAQSPGGTSLGYRPEIDGLRTVAVVPVVLFHAGLQVFSGGYIGVDVFFVISGHLITAILLNDIAAQRYSIARFYERRARRILPALLLVMLCCLPAAWFGLLPKDFQQFSTSILAVLGFVSNIAFWREEGYFATASELKPLLHTWSLAVEEQFYLAFPLVLLVLRKASRKTMAITLGAAALGSLVLCEVAAVRWPTANFYLAPTRAWELLGGSLCALWGRQSHRPLAGALAWFGLALILGAVFLFDSALSYPSHYTLVPVLGTMLLLAFARAEAGPGRLLALPPFVGIGLISYSLYLWHQPLFAFARQLTYGRPGHGLMLGLAALSVLLAWASWRWVETPFRQRGGPGEARRALTLAGLACAVLVGFAGYGLASGGIAGRLHASTDPAIRSFVASALYAETPGGDCKADANGISVPCTYVPNPAAPLRFAVYGDSHAQALLPAFAELARRRGLEMHFASVGGCPPLLGAHVINGNLPPGDCPILAEKELAAARANGIAAVFLVGRWTLYTDGDPMLPASRYLLSRHAAPFRPDRAEARRTLAATLARTIAAYRMAGIRVILVDQVPQQAFDVGRFVQWFAYRPDPQGPGGAITRTAVTRAEADALRAASRDLLRRQQGPGVSLLSLDPLFRSGDRYLWGDARGTWYSDSSHLTHGGALRVAPALSSALDAALAN